MQTSIHAEVVYHLAPEFSMRVRDRTIAVTGGDTVQCTSEVFDILNAFREPRTVADAMTNLSARTNREWMRRSGIVLQLIQAGVLISPEGGQTAHIESTVRQFGGAGAHISMLNDRIRTRTYIDAISEAITPSDIVVDLGTGTGVLALAAAQAGAKHVYAIERSGIANAARVLFENSEFSDRITLIQGRSTQIDLPQLANVFISEIIGNEPFGEYTLEFMLDARRRWLSKNPLLIPKSMNVFAYLVELEPSMKAKLRFSDEFTQRWTDWYGVDMSALARCQHEGMAEFLLAPKKVKQQKLVSAAKQVLSIDFEVYDSEMVDQTFTIQAVEDGQVDGVAVYFDLRLAENYVISTDPMNAYKDCSWSNVVWVLPEPVTVRAGDVLTFRYSHSPAGTQVNLESQG